MANIQVEEPAQNISYGCHRNPIDKNAEPIPQCFCSNASKTIQIRHQASFFKYHSIVFWIPVLNDTFGAYPRAVDIF